MNGITWQQSQDEARARIAALPLPPGSLAGLSITLVSYTDESIFKFEHGSTAAAHDHKVVSLAMARMLRQRGADVCVAPVTIDTILVWKTKQEMAQTGGRA